MKTSSILVLLLAVRLCRSEELEQPPRPVSRPVVRFPAEGGSKGAPFDDLHKISSSVFNIHSIAIGSGRHVDSIQVTYLLKSGSLYTAPKHGRGSKPPFTITLAADEYVAKVEGSTSGNVVNQLTITTKRLNLTTVHGPFGRMPGSRNFTLTESFILGFQGKSGTHLNSIGVYCLAPVKLSDNFGWYSIEFSEHPDGQFPPVVKVSKILVHHGLLIDSVQFQYVLHGGGKRLGKKRGGDGGNLTTIQLGPKDQLIGMSGLLNNGTFDDLQQVVFITQERGSLVKIHHGPFGNLGDIPFSLRGQIIGYAGSVEKVVDMFAAYYY